MYKLAVSSCYAEGERRQHTSSVHLQLVGITTYNWVIIEVPAWCTS